MSCRSTQPFAAVILLGLFCREQRSTKEKTLRGLGSVFVLRLGFGWGILLFEPSDMDGLDAGSGFYARH